LAGIAHVGSAEGACWDLVAIASAEHERDREIWARRRLILSVLLAAGLVLMFGDMAMRNQRKELLLEREPALADLAQIRDERLQRASRAAVMGTLAMGVARSSRAIAVGWSSCRAARDRRHDPSSARRGASR
jgi:hypothetical protein